MNVLWIEDFGFLQPDSATLINFFGDLIPSTVFNRNWNPETDLLDDPDALSRFCEHHSDIHALTLLRHYGDFIDLTGSHDIVGDQDIVAIDINLSSGVPKDVLLPEGHDDPNSFHKKAGVYIYHQLIQMGFPDDNICFLTGEKESTFAEFANHCRSALMPMPNAFGKDDAGMSDFRRWMDDHRKSDYITLRRGVIEGCKKLRDIARQPDGIQFNKFIKSDADAVSADSMDDYLSSLMRFLPLKLPANDEDRTRTLRLFTRAIVHEWESKVNPHASGDDKLRSLGWVMKETRNFLTHSQALNHLAEQDAAYLFLVDMRAMFAMPPQLMRFEAILLSLFEDVRRARFADKQQMEEALRCSHERLLNVFWESGGPRASRDFRELAKYADELRITGINYVVLSYQILWHQLAQRRGNKTDNAAGYKCNICPDTFGDEGSFLNTIQHRIII